MDFPSKNDNQLSLNDEITRFTQFLLGSPGQPLDLERNFDRFLSPAGTLRKVFQNYLITFCVFTQILFPYQQGKGTRGRIRGTIIQLQNRNRTIEAINSMLLLNSHLV